MVQKLYIFVLGAILCEMGGILFAQNNPSTSAPPENVSTEAATNVQNQGLSSDLDFLLGRYSGEGNRNLIFGRTSYESTDDSVNYKVTVLADARGIIKPGTVVTVVCHFVGLSFAPTDFSAANGAALLIGVEPDPKKPSVLYYVDNTSSPVGWECPRVIPEVNVKGVQDAMVALQSVMPKHPNNPLDRAKALEFFKSKNYETWALGASLLSASSAQPYDNARLLMGVFSDPHSNTAQALWAHRSLNIINFGPDAENSWDNIQKVVFGGEDFSNAIDDALFTYFVTHSPQLCDYPPAAAPATQPDGAATVQAAALIKKAWTAEAAAQIQGVKLQEQAMLLMGPDFWNHEGNLILAKVTAVQQKSKNDEDVTYTMEVQADARGSYNAGATVKVVGNLTPTDADWIPQFDKGMTVLLGIKPGGDKDTWTYTTNVCSPVGWRAGRPIPEDHVNAVETALGILKTVLPQHINDRLDEIKARELFKSTQYETWAVGATILASKGIPEDVMFFHGRPDVAGNQEVQMQQALWALYQGSRLVVSKDYERVDGDVADLTAFAKDHNSHFGGDFISSQPNAPLPTATAPATKP